MRSVEDDREELYTRLERANEELNAVMNGVEATKEILRIDPDTKIVFLSADASVMDEAMRAGAYIFLKKPASIKDILGAVESAIGRKLLPKQV